MKRIIAELESKGYLITCKNYNEKKYDRAKWYAIDYDLVEKISLVDEEKPETPHGDSLGQIDPLQEDNLSLPLGQFDPHNTLDLRTKISKDNSKDLKDKTFVQMELDEPILEPVLIPSEPSEPKTQNPTKAEILNQQFEELWLIYPRREGKLDARKAYFKHMDSKKFTFEEVRKGVADYASYMLAKRTDKQFIKMGSTFFNGAGWQDDFSIDEDFTEQASGKPTIAHFKDRFSKLIRKRVSTEEARLRNLAEADNDHFKPLVL